MLDMETHAGSKLKNLGLPQGQFCCLFPFVTTKRRCHCSGCCFVTGILNGNRDPGLLVKGFCISRVNDFYDIALELRSAYRWPCPAELQPTTE